MFEIQARRQLLLERVLAFTRGSGIFSVYGRYNGLSPDNADGQWMLLRNASLSSGANRQVREENPFRHLSMYSMFAQILLSTTVPLNAGDRFSIYVHGESGVLYQQGTERSIERPRV
jgi:hypothetical protein